MRLTGAFFANRAEVVDEMLNVEGGFWSTSFAVPGPMRFMVTPALALPLEPEGGGHTYSFRLAGDSAHVELGLDVVVNPAVN